jgi:hypothetical protein
MSKYTITRTIHAAHTGPRTGWDLEQIDVAADTRESIPYGTDGIPYGFEYHSGYRDASGAQHWLFTREAPFSVLSCGENCTAGPINSCDHGHQTFGDVRSLPIGGGANVIVCREHYGTEMQFRRERIAAGAPFDLPEWESLTVYGENDAQRMQRVAARSGLVVQS